MNTTKRNFQHILIIIIHLRVAYIVKSRLFLIKHFFSPFPPTSSPSIFYKLHPQAMFVNNINPYCPTKNNNDVIPDIVYFPTAFNASIIFFSPCCPELHMERLYPNASWAMAFDLAGSLSAALTVEEALVTYWCIISIIYNGL